MPYSYAVHDYSIEAGFAFIERRKNVMASSAGSGYFIVPTSIFFEDLSALRNCIGVFL